MISQNLLNALRKINEEFQEHEIPWILVGSLSLALQGVTITPHDIDILTDKEGALQCNEIYARYLKKAVEWSQTEQFASFFGEFQINDVRIEIMGDLKEKRGNKWMELKPRLINPHFIRVEDMVIPVSSLEDQLKSYEKSDIIKDKEKVELIERALNL